MTDFSDRTSSPRELLRATRELTQQVRAAQRGTWFPLLLLGTLVFASIPLLRFGPLTVGCRGVIQRPAAALTCAPNGIPCHQLVGGAAGGVCAGYPTLLFVYWPIVLVLAYAAIAAFYLRRSRARGVGTAIGRYAVIGAAIAVLVTAAALWEVHEPQLVRGSSLPGRLASASFGIGLGLLVLAWVERNRILLVFTAIYVAVVLVPVTFGWSLGDSSRWVLVPRVVVAGAVLVLGAVGFAIAELVRLRGATAMVVGAKPGGA
jgi:hypothetical protein